MPVFVVQLWMIRPIIITGPSRFLSEQGVPRHTFRGQDSVLKLPRPLELVKVLGSEIGEIFL
jgi:hypothetical protein